MRVSGNENFVVKVPNAQGNIRMRRGESVPIGWRMEDCRALDA